MTDGLNSSESLDSSKDLVDAADPPGAPGGLLRLWTPRRAAYISGAAEPEKTGECPFCVASSLSDTEALIVAKGRACFALLNLYSYNSSHILVCTYRHVSLCTDLTDEERVEVGGMTARAMGALDETLRPAGFNLGMNQGDVAGAGTAVHIHWHIIPRWLGDANFSPIITQMKTIPAILADTGNLISEAWSCIGHGSTGGGSMRRGAAGKGLAREDPTGEEGSRNAQ